MRTTEIKNEHKAPDAAGVYFTGETKSGYARYAIHQNFNSPINEKTLEFYCQWRHFGNASNALRILLQLWLDSKAVLEQVSLETDADDADEMALFFKFLSNIAAHDGQRLEASLDDLIEEMA